MTTGHDSIFESSKKYFDGLGKNLTVMKSGNEFLNLFFRLFQG